MSPKLKTQLSSSQWTRHSWRTGKVESRSEELIQNKALKQKVQKTVKGRGVTVRRPDKGFPGVLEEKTEYDRGNIYR